MWNNRSVKCVLWCVAAVCGATMGQESVSAPELGGAPNPLVAKQEMIRDRLDRLEDRMFRLRESLVEQEPENAERLAMAIERAGELGVEQRVDALLKMLAHGADLDKASDLQQALVDDLETMLRDLTEKTGDEDQREQDIARLEDAKERVEHLLDQQRTLREQTAQRTNRAQRGAQLKQAIKRLDEIIRRQQEAVDSSKSAKPGDESSQKELGKKQSEIKRDTQRLSEDVEALEGSSESESESESESGGKSKSGESAASDMKSAAKKMGEAQEDIDKGDTPAASEKQAEALEELKRARHKLEEAVQENADDEREERLAEAQRKLGEEAGETGKKMGSPQGGEQEGQQGGQQGGEQGGESQEQQQQKQAPGQQQVQEAQKHMDRAAEDLEKDQPRDATSDQDKALTELEDALADLEEALQQLRQEEQEEILRDLEARFRDMLVAQTKINRGTVELHAVGREQFRRAEQLRGAELTKAQSDLGREASKSLHILEEEGTTVVFPAILEQISSDMLAVADRLAELNVGALTQVMQEEIVATLQDLVDAIEKKRKEMEQQQQQGQSGQSGQDQPLLPTSAELKLLKSMQVRVLKRTQVIAAEHDAGTESADSLSKATRAVNRRQKEAARIATEMRDLENGL